jgi:hypothetical protein
MNFINHINLYKLYKNYINSNKSMKNRPIQEHSPQLIKIKLLNKTIKRNFNLNHRKKIILINKIYKITIILIKKIKINRDLTI